MTPTKEALAKGLAEALAKGLAEGKAEGLAEGKAKGLAEGKAQGLLEAKAETLLMLLSARGLPVTPALRKKIRACTDPAVLDRWLRSALTAASASQALSQR